MGGILAHHVGAAPARTGLIMTAGTGSSGIGWVSGEPGIYFTAVAAQTFGSWTGDTATVTEIVDHLTTYLLVSQPVAAPQLSAMIIDGTRYAFGTPTVSGSTKYYFVNNDPGFVDGQSYAIELEFV